VYKEVPAFAAGLVFLSLVAASAGEPKTRDVSVVGPDTQLGADAGAQPVNAHSADLRGDWQAFLQEKGLNEGQNEPAQPGQAPFQIFSEVGDISLSPTDPGWLDARAAAYGQAILKAKAKYVEFLDSEISAGRSSKLFKKSGTGIPSAEDKVAQTLSTMDKMRTLTDKALDAQIKNYDPTWDGTGKTQNDRQDRVVMMRRQYEEQIQTSAQGFTTGAAPIYTAEGPTRNGYGVLVGIVISENMQKIARAFTDPSIVLASNAVGLPIRRQIGDRYRTDPTFLTATEGVRIMTDEHGARALVCFAGVMDTGDSMTTEKSAELTCQASIAEFVSEQVASESSAHGGVATDTLAPQGPGTVAERRTEFNKELRDETTAFTPRISMSGLMQIAYYETQHQYTHQPMVVAVYEWSQGSSAIAQQLKRASETPGNVVQAAPADGSAARPTVPAATTVDRGLSTNPSEY
jgi:hypothetical protein